MMQAVGEISDCIIELVRKNHCAQDGAIFHGATDPEVLVVDGFRTQQMLNQVGESFFVLLLVPEAGEGGRGHNHDITGHVRHAHDAHQIIKSYRLRIR